MRLLYTIIFDLSIVKRKKIKKFFIIFPLSEVYLFRLFYALYKDKL